MLPWTQPLPHFFSSLTSTSYCKVKRPHFHLEKSYQADLLSAVCRLWWKSPLTYIVDITNPRLSSRKNVHNVLKQDCRFVPSGEALNGLGKQAIDEKYPSTGVGAQNATLLEYNWHHNNGDYQTRHRSNYSDQKRQISQYVSFDQQHSRESVMRILDAVVCVLLGVYTQKELYELSLNQRCEDCGGGVKRHTQKQQGKIRVGIFVCSLF